MIFNEKNKELILEKFLSRNNLYQFFQRTDDKFATLIFKKSNNKSKLINFFSKYLLQISYLFESNCYKNLSFFTTKNKINNKN